MEWFYFALVAGISWGLLSGTTKKLLEHDSVIEFTFIIHFTALVLYTPFFLYFLSIKDLVLEGVALALVSGLVNVVGIYLYNDSIQIGRLSEEIPLTRTTPLFTALFGTLLLGETLNLARGAGIALVTAGSIIVMKDGDTSVGKSLGKIMRKKAAGLAVLSAVVYSVAALIDRMGTQAVSPELYAFFIYLMLASAFLGINYAEGNTPGSIYRKFKDSRRVYLFSALLALIGSLSVFRAFSLAEASLVVPVLQVQVFIALLIGKEYFGEGDLMMKALGSTILVAGIAMLIH